MLETGTRRLGFPYGNYGGLKCDGEKCPDLFPDLPERIYLIETS
jgi:hypothetical protein